MRIDCNWDWKFASSFFGLQFQRSRFNSVSDFGIVSDFEFSVNVLFWLINKVEQKRN